MHNWLDKLPSLLALPWNSQAIFPTVSIEIRIVKEYRVYWVIYFYGYLKLINYLKSWSLIFYWKLYFLQYGKSDCHFGKYGTIILKFVLNVTSQSKKMSIRMSKSVCSVTGGGGSQYICLPLLQMLTITAHNLSSYVAQVKSLARSPSAVSALTPKCGNIVLEARRFNYVRDI